MTGVIGLSLEPGIEAEPLQPLLEETSVLPQAFDDLRLVDQDVERGHTGQHDRRRMRGREEERTRAVIEKFDQVGVAGDVAAKRADRLRERADLDVDPAVHAEVIDRAAAVRAEHPARVGIVDHHDAAGFLGQLAQRPAAAPRSPSMLKTPSVISSLRWPMPAAP